VPKKIVEQRAPGPREKKNFGLDEMLRNREEKGRKKTDLGEVNWGEKNGIDAKHDTPSPDVSAVLLVYCGGARKGRGEHLLSILTYNSRKYDDRSGGGTTTLISNYEK